MEITENEEGGIRSQGWQAPVILALGPEAGGSKVPDQLGPPSETTEQMGTEKHTARKE